MPHGTVADRPSWTGLSRPAWHNGTMLPTPNSRQGSAAGAVLACGVLFVLLAGCGAGGSANQPAAGNTNGSPAAPESPAAPQGQAAAVSGTSPQATGSTGDPLGATPAGASAATATDTVKRTVTDTLSTLAAGTPKPATAQVTDALTGAGIAPAALQVSQSRTPTGLEADAIEAAVLQGSDCVIGQVREGAVTVTVLPVLASGKCFVGS